jgi:DNA (cytosine-5)-methyltransferase 1
VDRFREIIKLSHAEGRLNTSISADIRARFGIKKMALRVLDPDRPSPTITSMPDDLLHYSEPRTLTVRENARLQTFPDWYSFQGKYTTGGHLRKQEVPRFTQVANAVPPLVARAIGETLTELLRNNSVTEEVSRRKLELCPHGIQ